MANRGKRQNDAVNQGDKGRKGQGERVARCRAMWPSAQIEGFQAGRDNQIPKGRMWEDTRGLSLFMGLQSYSLLLCLKKGKAGGICLDATQTVQSGYNCLFRKGVFGEAFPSLEYIGKIKIREMGETQR